MSADFEPTPAARLFALLDRPVCRLGAGGSFEPLDVTVGLDRRFDVEVRDACASIVASVEGDSFVETLPGPNGATRSVIGIRTGEAWWLALDDSPARLVEQEAELRSLARLRTLGRLLDGLVHDLKNSLHGVGTFGEEVARRAADAGIEQRIVDALDDCVKRGLLALTFATELAAKRRQRPERIDFAALVERVMHAMVGAAIRRGVQLTYRSSADPIWVWSSFEDLTQVATQLAYHAVQTAGPSGRLDSAIIEGPAAGEVALQIRLDGDPARDLAIRALSDAPELAVQGERSAEFAADADLLRASWAALHLIAGGRVEWRLDGVMRETAIVARRIKTR